MAAGEHLAGPLPDARHDIATDRSYYVQLERPEIVVDAVLAVVTAVRNPAAWAVDGT